MQIPLSKSACPITVKTFSDLVSLIARMAPVPQEQNKAAVGEPDITGNAANQAEFSKPAFTLSTSAVRQPEERVDEDDPFYRLLKSKRVSSANLKTLSSTSSSLGADDVLYSPTEGKFTNKLEVLEEVSEPDTASFSETDTRVPVISKNFSTAQRTARTVTTARRAGKAASEFSLNDRVSQSQYLLDQILHKLASKETATDRDFPFTSNLIANLRPHSYQHPTLPHTSNYLPINGPLLFSILHGKVQHRLMMQL